MQIDNETLELCKRLNGVSASYNFPNIIYNATIALATVNDKNNNGFILEAFGLDDTAYSKRGVDSEYVGIRAFITFRNRVPGISTESFDILNMATNAAIITKYKLNDALNQVQKSVINEDNDSEPFDLSSLDGFKKPDQPKSSTLGFLRGMGNRPPVSYDNADVWHAEVFNPKDGK